MGRCGKWVGSSGNRGNLCKYKFLFLCVEMCEDCDSTRVHSEKSFGSKFSCRNVKIEILTHKTLTSTGNSCGFGSNKDNCAVCGRWCGSSSYPAKLCSSCGFGSSGDNCVKCNRWCGSTKIPAKLCSSCGFGSSGDKCAKVK